MRFHHQDVAKDGNCLFSCIGLCIGKPSHLVRKTVCKTLKKLWFQFPLELRSSDEDGSELDGFAYLRHMKKTGTWGGTREIHAANVAYQMKFIIHMMNGVQMSVVDEINGQNYSRTCHLLLDEQHYTLLIPENAEEIDDSTVEETDCESSESSQEDSEEEVEEPEEASQVEPEEASQEEPQESSETSWIAQDVSETYKRAYDACHSKFQLQFVTQESAPYDTLRIVAGFIPRIGFLTVIGTDEEQVTAVRHVTKFCAFYSDDVYQVTSYFGGRQVIGVINLDRIILFSALHHFLHRLFATLHKNVCHPNGVSLYFRVRAMISPAMCIILSKRGLDLPETPPTAQDIVNVVTQQAKKFNIRFLELDTTPNLQVTAECPGIATATIMSAETHSSYILVKCRIQPKVTFFLQP